MIDASIRILMVALVLGAVIFDNCRPAQAGSDDALRAIRALERTAAAVERLERSCR